MINEHVKHIIESSKQDFLVYKESDFIFLLSKITDIHAELIIHPFIMDGETCGYYLELHYHKEPRCYLVDDSSIGSHDFCLKVLELQAIDLLLRQSQNKNMLTIKWKYQDSNPIPF